MYIPKHYKEPDHKKLAAFMREYNFAAIVSRAKKRYWATHLPFVIEEVNNKITLKSHMAKANPQWVNFGREEVLIIFQQPHAYISPKLYEHTKNVPTWNYAAVHAYGTPKILPSKKQKVGLLEETFETFEKDFLDQWKSLPADYKDKLLRNIVAFEIKVNRLEGKFKLSQNKTDLERDRIISSLSQSADKIKVDLSKLIKSTKT